MSKRSDENWDELRQAVLGLGAASSRKSHYPGLRQRVAEAERFRSVLDLSGDLLIIVDAATGVVLDVNQTLGERLGRPVEELVGRMAAELLPHDCARSLEDLIADFRLGARDRATLNSELRDGRGMAFAVEISARCGSAGGSTYAVLAVRDISERVEAAAALAASEERFRTIVDSVNDAIIVFDADSLEPLWFNQRLCQLYGISPGAARAARFGDFAVGEPPYTRAEARVWMRRAVDEGPQLFEWRARRPDGGLLWLEMNLRRGSVLGRECVLMTGRDISERKRLEGELLEAQKLEAIGLLAGGVAHDFNNLLTVINGYGELVAGELAPDHPLRGAIEEIRHAGARAADLTRQLLAFSRRQILEPRSLDLNTVVRDAESMLRRLIGENTELVLHLEPDLPAVETDPNQILQVVINLVVNAREAMPGGGRITLETMPSGAEQAEGAVGQGPFVCLLVGDSGAGMDESTLAHIFEPFFSTKGLAQAAGLGLATVYGTVKQTGGHITVESQLGVGTTFRVWLPVAAGGTGRPPAPEQALPARGSETILLVEDQDEVRHFAAEALSGCGYRVLEASRADQALELCRESGRSIDLLLTDVVMPGLNGPELADAARDLLPNLRVLLITGDPARALARKPGARRPARPCLQKPFGPRELAEKVRAVLDGLAPE